VIGFLRFVGIVNAAVWLGAAVFFCLSVQPAVYSPEMMKLLEPKNYPFFSGAIAQILGDHLFHVEIICGIIALLHVVAEWLYFGKSLGQLWLGLLLVVWAVALFGGVWIRPQLKELHARRYAINLRPEQRDAAAQSFNAWHKASEFANLVMVAGVAVYLWRVANPPDPARFVSTAKFRH
jgi:hypothetical protein